MRIEAETASHRARQMTGLATGRFITLEGGEGVGKSVQAARLEARLAGLGLKVVRAVAFRPSQSKSNAH